MSPLTGRTLLLGLLCLASLGACSARAEEEDDESSGGSAVREQQAPRNLQEQTLTLAPNENAEIWFTAVNTAIASLEFKGAANLTARLDPHAPNAQGVTDIVGAGMVFLDICAGQACLKNGTLAQESRPHMVSVRNTSKASVTVIRRILPVAYGPLEETDQSSACRTAANGPGSTCSRECGPNKTSAKGECIASRESLTLPKINTVVGRCNAVCR